MRKRTKNNTRHQKRKYTRRKRMKTLKGGEPLSLLLAALYKGAIGHHAITPHHANASHHANAPHHNAIYTESMHHFVNYGKGLHELSQKFATHANPHNLHSTISKLTQNVETYATELSDPIMRFSLMIKAHKLINEAGDYVEKNNPEYRNYIIREITYHIIGTLLIGFTVDEHLISITNTIIAVLDEHSIDSLIRQIATIIKNTWEGKLLKEYQRNMSALPRAIPKLYNEIFKVTSEFLTDVLSKVKSKNNQKDDEEVRPDTSLKK